MKKQNRFKTTLTVAALLLAAFPGCAARTAANTGAADVSSVQATADTGAADASSAQGTTDANTADASASQAAADAGAVGASASQGTADAVSDGRLEPVEGEYSNDYEEILNIRKNDDKYEIEYSIIKLTYVENAEGTYDPATGILHFSGMDDTGSVLEADIITYEDHLEVTVTDSAHSEVVGTTQAFYLRK